VVESIKEFRAELEIALVLLLPEGEPLQHREIEVVGGRADNGIPACRTIAANKIIGEARDVEPFRRVVRKIVGIARDIGPRAGLRARKLQSGGRIQRISGLDRDNAIGLPSSKQGIHLELNFSRRTAVRGRKAGHRYSW